MVRNSNALVVLFTLINLVNYIDRGVIPGRTKEYVKSGCDSMDLLPLFFHVDERVRTHVIVVGNPVNISTWLCHYA